MRIRLTVGTVIVILAAPFAQAAPLSTEFTYQGQLNDGGNPANGIHDMRFRLYDASTLGAQVGAVACFDNASVTDGLFTVPLDFGAQFAGEQRFLKIEVRADTGLTCANASGFIILSPRQTLTAAPNALFASNADRFDGLNSTAFLQSIPVPLALSGTSAVSIIHGQNTSTSGLNYGVWGESDSTEGRGVFGRADALTGTNYGVYGRSLSMSGRGVFGEATAATGASYGGWFQSNSSSGLGVYATGASGVYGSATATSGFHGGGHFESASGEGYGVLGHATAAGGVTFGGYFQSDSAQGIGVYGESDGTGVYASANAANGITSGVYATSFSPSGRGVFGAAHSATGAAYGVHGHSDSTSGRGVYGQADATGGSTTGVYGESASTSGRGVFGFASAGSNFTYGGRFQSASTSGRGVFGWASGATGTTYGVMGQADTSGTGYAVFANGDLGGSGFKGFRIDHPDDPANTYLLHYAAESPEVINFYRGIVILDGAGEARVELPPYFAKINKTPSYVLTAIGAPMPMLHVAGKISDTALNIGANAEPDEAAPLCSFRIAGGAPGGEVSWRVEALRNDRWVQKRGAPVEVEKQDLEKGTYQHPDLYGLPAEKGMDYEVEHERPSPPAAPDAPSH